MSRSPTTDQLRASIDRGAQGDKVDWPDPAAVPLGADEEAGGQSPDDALRQQDAAPSPEATPRKRDMIGVWVYVAVAVFLLVIFSAIALLAGSRG